MKGYRVMTLVAVVVACDQPIEPDPPVYLDAVVAVGEVNGLSAEVRVRGVRYDSARVTYWTTGEPAAITPSAPFGVDSAAMVPVLGLLAGRPYSLEIGLYDGSWAAVDTASLVTDTLPDWVPRPGVLGTDTTPGFLAASFPGGAVILDNQGRTRWYAHNPDGVLNSFQAHDHGAYTAFRLSDSPAQFRVLDTFGRQSGTLGCAGGRPTRFHDVLVLAGGDYWVLCDDSVTMDLSAVGGQADARTAWSVVQHVSAAGSLLFEWRSYEHFDITDLPVAARAGATVNVTHGNGVVFDTDGNLLVSLRNIDVVAKVHPTTGAVLWRLGGVRSSFTFVNDPLGGFDGQHGVAPVGAGVLQMLDNRSVAPSRLVRYQLDTLAMTATMVLDFRDSPATFTAVGGSTQYYPNGHAVVTFGRAGRVVEIDEAGNRAWELTGINNTYVFRVQRMASLYAPRRALEDP